MERSLGVKDFKILTALEERVDEALDIVLEQKSEESVRLAI